MLDVDFQLSLESRKKQSPGGVLQNGSPKDFKENSNNNIYDGLFLKLKMVSMKFVRPFRTVILYGTCKLLLLLMIQKYISTDKSKKINMTIKLFTNKKCFHAH